MKTVSAWVTTKKGNSFKIALPAMVVVCPHCDGSGTELRGGLKDAVISQDNLSDPDFCEAYFGGDYDVACSVCRGRNVIKVVDYDALTAKMRERYDRAERERAKADAEERIERRWAGG